MNKRMEMLDLLSTIEDQTNTILSQGMKAAFLELVPPEGRTVGEIKAFCEEARNSHSTDCEFCLGAREALWQVIRFIEEGK